MHTDNAPKLGPNKENRLIATEEELEHAIDVLQQFTQPNESENLPSLEHFKLKDNGKIEIRKLSALEKTLNYLMGVPKEKTAELKAIKGRVLRSVDIIKIAILRLKASSQIDEKLEKRLLTLIQRYNSVMKKAQKEPKKLSAKLKYFFLKACGFNLDQETVKHEIQLPSQTFYDSTEPQSILSHKITPRRVEATTQKITSFVQGVAVSANETTQQEKELFHMKAITLLSKEHPEALERLSDTSRVEVTLTKGIPDQANWQTSSNSIISLRQTITPFPGEEIELFGAFSRSSQNMSIPIKESFRITSKAFQTGFPDPLQSIGITFGECFLPEHLLRPYLAPQIDAVLKKKQEIAEKLLPNGSFNSKAKALLQKRKELFQAHKTLALKLKDLLKHLFEKSEEIDALFPLLSKKDNFFEEISFLHAMCVKSCIERPFQLLQQKLFSEKMQIKDREHLLTFCKEQIELELLNLTKALEKEIKPEEKILLEYKVLFAKFLAQDAPVIFTYFLSEQFGFKPLELNSRQKKLIAAAFIQQKAFIKELDELDPEQDDIDEILLQTISQEIERHILLFTKGNVDDPSVSELEKYLIERFASNNA